MKTRYIVVFTLVLLTAVFSATALTANLNGPSGQQAGSFAANLFSMFSGSSVQPLVSATPPEADSRENVKRGVPVKGDHDPQLEALVTFTGTTTGGPTFSRPNCATFTAQCVPVATVAGAFPYATITFTVTVTGAYQIDLVDTGTAWDTHADLYQGSFNPASPLANAVQSNDDNGATLDSRLNVNLTAGTTYIFIATGFTPGDFGAFSAAVDGPGSAVSNTVCAAPPADMVAWYPGEVNTNDIIGDPPNNGTVQGALGYTTGKVGNGFNLNGASNVQVPPSAGLNVGASSGITFDAWINPANTAAGMPIIEYNNGTQVGPLNGVGVLFWHSVLNPGDLYADFVDTGGIQHVVATPGGVVTAGTFQHVAVTYVKGTGAVEFYVNGVNVHSGNAGTLYTPQTGAGYSMYIGRRPPSGPYAQTYYSGIIDELEIFSRALTGDEVRSINGAGTNGKCHVSQIQFATAAKSVNENAGTITTVVKRVGANDSTATVAYNTADGTATGGGVDYGNASTSVVTFGPGERTQNVTIPIIDDAIDEIDETFTATISLPTGPGVSIGSPATKTITILDNDAVPVITVNSASGTEGTPPGAGGSATFVVTKTGSTTFSSSATYAFGGGNATGGASCATLGVDYINTGSTVTFPASTTTDTQNVVVNFCPDSNVEVDETFTMTLTPVGATSTVGAPGTGTIIDDDSTVQFTAATFSDTEGNTARPATKNLAVTVSRTASGSGAPAASVDISTIGAATATGGFLNCTLVTSDFVIVSGATINWAAGDTATKTFNFTGCQDTVIEDDETFSGQLSNPVGTQIGTTFPTMEYTIFNDDGAATFSHSSSSAIASQAEGTSFNFPIVRNFPVGTTGTDLASTVDFTVTGSGANPATPGDDVDASGSVNFPAGGATTVNAVIATNNDTLFEPTEGFTVTLDSATNGSVVAPLARSSSITDNDPRPVFRIRENRVQVEGNGGQTAMIFDIDKISGDAQYPQTVRFGTCDGGGPTAATAPSDYTAIGSGNCADLTGDTVVFGQTQLTAQFAVIINGDTTFEDDEVFTTIIKQVTIQGTAYADAIGSPASRTGTITNDDAAPVFVLEATAGSPNESEPEGSGAGTTVLRFSIRKTGLTQLQSIVSANTVDGTAVAPGDYTALVNAAVATFDPNDTLKTFDINVVRDTIYEGNETLTVNLSNVTNGTFGTPISGTGTIENDEGAPNFSMANASATEGTAVPFVVTRTFPSGTGSTELGSTLTCVSSVSGANTTTQAQSNDFTVGSQTITFGVADATRPCNVATTVDGVFEGNETFTQTLTGVTNFGTVSAPVTGTINNDDACSFAASSLSQAEGNTLTSNFIHNIVKTCDTGTFVALVSYDSIDGGTPPANPAAVSPVDYTEILPGTLAFQPAEASKPLPVSVNGDLTEETDENYTVRLTGASVNGVPVTSLTNGIGTILNDDGVPITISGTITNFSPAGPLAGVTVCLTGSATPPCTTTNAAGFYSFANLPSNGSFLVTPTMAGKVMSPTNRTYTGISASVTNANFVAYDTGSVPRSLTANNAYTTPGSPVTQTFTLAAQGDEASLSFSVNYDPAILSAPVVACGVDSGAGCPLLFNTGTPGVIGVSVDPVAATWAAGSRIVITITYATAPTAASNTPVTFGDVPTLRRTSDSGSNPLPTVYNNGFIVFAQGLESDVAPRPTGGFGIQSDDVIQTRRFTTGLDTPNPAFNEFQRADSAPAGTKGDGQLGADDVIQARRYSVGLDPTQTAGGPTGPIPPAPAPEASVKGDKGKTEASVGRIWRILNSTGSPGTQVTNCTEIDSQNDEAGYQTSVTFDPTKVSISSVSSPAVNPDVTLGTGVAAGSSLTVNATQANLGRIGFLVDSSVALVQGTRQVVCLRFTILPGTVGPTTVPLTFGNVPTPGSMSDLVPNSLTYTTEPGQINVLGPTAAGVSVSGRVTTPSGAGLRGATVVITDSEGVRRTATTSTFGYFQFEDIEVGNTYIIGVTSRRFRFAPRTLQVLDSLTDVDFVGQE